MDLVARYPRVGKRVHPEADAEYRSVVADSYLVWYQVRGTDEVIVLAVRHGKQRPPKLAELEERAEPQP